MPVKLAVLFSGGKDSVFACYRAMETDEVACLISLISENEESYMFHTPNIKWTSKLAEAMGLPILSWKTRGEKESELDDLEDAISLARDRFGIEGVVTGAIESVYQATRVQKICKSLDLWCFNPLWQINQLDYLRLLLSEGFEVMISGVFAYPLDESWVGAMLSEDLIQKLERLSSRYKINPSGEGGELETFVLDCPIFGKRVVVTNSSRSYENYRGQLTILDMRLEDKRLEDIELARRRPEDRVQEDQAQIGKVQADKVQADKVQADKVQLDKVQLDKVQLDKVQLDKVQLDKVQLDKVQGTKCN
jgi:ABC transporter with metal-binding/Fe-S-binding domain ATP-binding protein